MPSLKPNQTRSAEAGNTRARPQQHFHSHIQHKSMWLSYPYALMCLSWPLHGDPTQAIQMRSACDSIICPAKGMPCDQPVALTQECHFVPPHTIQPVPLAQCREPHADYACESSDLSIDNRGASALIPPWQILAHNHQVHILQKFYPINKWVEKYQYGIKRRQVH